SRTPPVCGCRSSSFPERPLPFAVSLTARAPPRPPGRSPCSGLPTSCCRLPGGRSVRRASSAPRRGGSYRSGERGGACYSVWPMNDAQLQAAYTSATGKPAGRVERLPGGAGNRTYWRVHGLKGETAVVMELPPDPVKSEEASKDHAPEELPFLNV